MIKNISHFLLILVLLTGCQFMPTGKNYTFPSKDFEFDKRCPHICWLGINPGETKAEEAKSLILSSNQIDQKRIQVSSDGIAAVWMGGKNKDFPTIVGIQFENGLVKSISFGQIPFTMDNFIKLLGDPEDIIAWNLERADGYEIGYRVYFSAQNIVIEGFPFAVVENGNWNGPDPNDSVRGLWLNTELRNDVVPDGLGIIRPWVGYGHIKDYLPGGIQYPPTDTPPTP